MTDKYFKIGKIQKLTTETPCYTTEDLNTSTGVGESFRQGHFSYLKKTEDGVIGGFVTAKKIKKIDQIIETLKLAADNTKISTENVIIISLTSTDFFPKEELKPEQILAVLVSKWFETTYFHFSSPLRGGIEVCSDNNSWLHWVECDYCSDSMTLEQAIYEVCYAIQEDFNEIEKIVNKQKEIENA